MVVQKESKEDNNGDFCVFVTYMRLQLFCFCAVNEHVCAVVKRRQTRQQ